MYGPNMRSWDFRVIWFSKNEFLRTKNELLRRTNEFLRFSPSLKLLQKSPKKLDLHFTLFARLVWGPGARCREPHAEHHFAYFFEPLLIWGSIGWPLKCKLMGFFGHMLLSRAPPPCVVLCQGPEVNFPGHPRVTKLFCIGSPLNRSQSLTYCIDWSNLWF